MVRIMRKRYYIYEIKEQKPASPKLILDHRNLSRIHQPKEGYPSENLAKVALRGMLKHNTISGGVDGKEFIIEPVYKKI